jgi:hypothetical protein
MKTFKEYLIQESSHRGFNLLLNKEDVFAALELMEGPGWLQDQLDNYRGYNSLVGALEWLKNRSEADTMSYIVYGSGGWHRYSVTVNGDVRFSAGHAQKKDIQKAKDLGFDVFGEIKR